MCVEIHFPLPAPGFGLCRADGDPGRFHRQADRSQKWLLRDGGDRPVRRTSGGRRFQTLEREPACLAWVVPKEIELQLCRQLDRKAGVSCRFNLPLQHRARRERNLVPGGIDRIREADCRARNARVRPQGAEVGLEADVVVAGLGPRERAVLQRDSRQVIDEGVGGDLDPCRRVLEEPTQRELSPDGSTLGVRRRDDDRLVPGWLEVIDGEHALTLLRVGRLAQQPGLIIDEPGWLSTTYARASRRSAAGDFANYSGSLARSDRLRQMSRRAAIGWRPRFR